MVDKRLCEHTMLMAVCLVAEESRVRNHNGKGPQMRCPAIISMIFFVAVLVTAAGDVGMSNIPPLPPRNFINPCNQKRARSQDSPCEVSPISGEHKRARSEIDKFPGTPMPDPARVVLRYKPAMGGRVLEAARSFECGELIFEERPLAIGAQISFSPLATELAEAEDQEEAHLRSIVKPTKQLLLSFLSMTADQKQRLLTMYHEEDCEESADLVKNLACYASPKADGRQTVDSKSTGMLMIECAHAVEAALALIESSSALEQITAQHDVTQISEDGLIRNLRILLSVWDLNSYAVPVLPFLGEDTAHTQLIGAAVLAAEGKSKQEIADTVHLRALFPNIALIPHSCHPNVKVATLTGFGQVVAAGKIMEGDLLASFYPEDTSLLWYGVGVRQEFLSYSRGFDCGCSRCVYDTAVDARATDILLQHMLTPHLREHLDENTSDQNTSSSKHHVRHVHTQLPPHNATQPPPAPTLCLDTGSELVANTNAHSDRRSTNASKDARTLRSKTEKKMRRRAKDAAREVEANEARLEKLVFEHCAASRLSQQSSHHAMYYI